MINTLHFPFPPKGEIFISPKSVMEEKMAKKQAQIAASETLPVVSFEPGQLINTKEKVLEAMQVQSKAFDMLKLKMARKKLFALQNEQKIPVAA
jgi:hypothetical protein